MQWLMGRMRRALKSYSGFSTWLFVVALLIAVALARWPEQNWLATDFQALLPSSSSDSWVEQANQEAASVYNKQVLWLLEGDDPAKVSQHLAAVLQRLADTGYADSSFEKTQTQRWQTLSATLYPHRWGLLSAADKATLQRDPAAYFVQFQRLLYSPVGSRQLSMLESDPMGFYGKFLQATAPGSSNSGSQGPRYWQVGAVSIDPRRLGFDALGGLYSLYQSLKAEAQLEGMELYATGVPLYSAYGVHSAKLEMSTIGVISLVLLVGLLLWALRSANAVVLTLFCVFSGLAGGLVVTVAVLQEIHILTLVFGATLIGIAADYALHYFAHALLPDWCPKKGLSKVYRGLVLSMLSSVIAFSALVILPFPGIQQIGLFMASGLLCSFLTVCLLFPLAFQRRPPRRPLPSFFARQQWVWHRSVTPILALFFMAILGLVLLPTGDDIRDFYLAPEELTVAETALALHLQSKPDSRYFLLQARHKNELFTLEQQVMEKLQLLQEQGLVGRFFGITRLVPAVSTQRENNALFHTLEAQGYFTQHMQAIGFSSVFTQALEEELRSEFTPLNIDKLETLELPLGVGGFLGCHENGCASWIRLSSIQSLEALQELAANNTNLRLIDPIDDINREIAKYRAAVGGMIVIAMLLTLGFLSVVCGVRKALQIVFLPVAACLLCLLIIGLTHGAYTIVNLMALLLVMGVGLDYAIFRAFTLPQQQSATTLAITLSALTSILAFGMLSFSSTPVISNFGQTIALGLFFAYCFSWLRFDEEATSASNT